MEDEHKRAPWAIFLLCAFLLVQGVGATGGGLCLIISPSGEMMGMRLSQLDRTPFRDFLMPGIVLCLLLGIFPLLLLYPLLKRPNWGWANTLNVYSDKFWAWTYGLYVGIMLVLWIDFQILFIGYGHILQTIFGLLGVFITVTSLLPSVQRWYTMDIGTN